MFEEWNQNQVFLNSFEHQKKVISYKEVIPTFWYNFTPGL